MINARQASGLIWSYLQHRISEQIKAVFLIVTYLILFQVFVLGLPILEAGTITIGMVLVILGLTFFMEGLVLGLMPLGEIIGLKLPEKSKPATLFLFAFVLGIGATFAEPAIGVLKLAGASVKAWEAPLLFLLLNKHADMLVYSVGVGVGLAVVFGMMRFLYDWSLKPLLYVLVPTVIAATIWCYQDPNLIFITGLAWDSGAVTTGPVTVPLVLALGIGITRVVSSGDGGESQGFGVVTLASLFPIIAVFTLGISLSGKAPQPMSEQEFFAADNRNQAMQLFSSKQEFIDYGISHGSEVTRYNFLREKTLNPVESGKNLATQKPSSDSPNNSTLVWNSVTTALQAILPLSIFLLLVLRLLLRNRLPKPDEVTLGIVFAVIGMAIFNLGITMGLAKLGEQIGGKLPAGYKSIELAGETRTIENFSTDVLLQAVTPSGESQLFFYAENNGKIQPHNFSPEQYDARTSEYRLTPRLGPLFGSENGLTGILVILSFAFIMGYAATLAEPALNALGATVEQLTVGTFRKSLLMQAVAIGVGVGIALGVAKVVWNLPLMWLLAPPYLLLLFLTWLSTEEFTNIAWDSAGVTTGPITVPLVLAMGLGLGAQAGVVEGFGVLAMASVCPILSVLAVGLWVSSQRKRVLQQAETEVKGAGEDNMEVQP